MGKFLSESEKSIIKNNAFNVSANFLSGQTTNIVDSVMNNDTMKNVSNLAVSGAGIASIGTSMIKGEYFSEMQQIVERVISYAVQEITVEIGNYIGTKVAELVVPDTNYINKVMNDEFNENKTTLAKEIEKFSESSESRQNAIDKQNEENEKTEKFKKIKEMSEKVKTWIDEESPKITEKVNEIVSKYLLFGPEDLENQIDSYISKTKNELTKTTDEKLNSIYEFKKTTEENIGKKMGKKLADTYNDTIAKQAQKQQININKAKAKAKQVAAAATQFAKLQIMALTGINIP